jgi:preprotein translocase subunit SecY
MKNMFKVPDLRNKILFTLFMLVLYRLGSHIPVPGIDVHALKTLQQQAESGGVLGFLQLFSGGAITQFAVFALGIMPYITSSIIMQILAVVIPKLEQWQEQGAVGQRKITQWTRYLTVAIAIMQSTGLTFLFHKGGSGFSGGNPTTIDLFGTHYDAQRVLLVVLTLTAGTALLMWMGELITQRGIGNGMSLLIFASVVSRLPANFGAVKAQSGIVVMLLVGAMFTAVLVAIVFMEQGQRRIPVQFAKRVVGRRQFGGQSTYIPLKVNSSGVIPIIFASSVLYLPIIIAQVLPTKQNATNTSGNWAWHLQKFLNNTFTRGTGALYLFIYGVLIIGFAYFYTAIQFDPHRQADQIRKQGGFIPGIRPGPQTERYLAKILNRITLPGALFICAVALIPAYVLGKTLGGTTGTQLGFFGISILIAVGVALETLLQIDSQLMMRNYEGFLKS